MMNCHHAQNLVSAFIDCELTVEEKRELRKHLFLCRECNLEYQQILQLKNCLENISQESFGFDPLESLRARLTNEEHMFFQPVNRSYLFSRIGIVATCILIFFLTTLLLFPKEKSLTGLAKDNPVFTIDPVTSDQDFSIDHSVNVYQASFVMP